MGWPAPASGAASDPAARQRPNIVFILADDLGWGDVNCFDPKNRGFYETPHLNRLARQGMRFTSAYTNAANCAPTRAALMSGQQYPNNPVYTVGTGARGRARHRALTPVKNQAVLPTEKITLAECLQQAGYTTGFMGKWHLGSPPNAGPRQQGFDVNVGGYRSGMPAWPGGYFRPDNNPHINDASKDEYLTDYLTRKAVSFIDRHQDKPFYLQLSYYSVHTPIQAPEARTAKYQKKQPADGHDNPTYAAMIESVDRGVGRIMAKLDALGLKDNTIVIFFSDNGGLGGYASLGLPGGGRRGVTDQSPLKGGKGSFFEGGIRVPLIVRWPDHVSADTATDEPVIGMDLYPTLLDATGVSAPADYALDGVSLMPALKDPDRALDREALYWHFPGYLQYRGPDNWRTTPVSVIRQGPWKLMKFYENNELKLYNLRDDLSETNNLAADRPQKRKMLHQKLQRWLETHDAPLPQRKGQ
jgi:arylsulfatase A-like enzyme